MTTSTVDYSVTIKPQLPGLNRHLGSALAAPNGRVLHKWQNHVGGRWFPSQTGWVDMGGRLTADPVTVLSPNGGLSLFGRSHEEFLSHAWQTHPGGAWDLGWIRMSLGPMLGRPAVAVAPHGGMHVFAWGKFGDLLHWWQEGFSGPWREGNLNVSHPIVSQPSAVVNPSGKISVFARARLPAGFCTSGSENPISRADGTKWCGSRRGVLGAGAAATALTVTGALGSTAHAGPTPTFGFRLREVDYTPPPGGPGLVMGGYGWGRRLNNGVVTRRLRAQCTQISHGSNFVVLLRVDVISIPSEVFKRIEQGLVNQRVLAAGQLMFTSSHTHNGPMVGHRPGAYVPQGITGAELESVTEFTDMFVDTMIELVRQTLVAPLIPVTLGYAEGLGFLAANRANVKPPVPPEISVLLARHADTGVPVAVLFGHACHPVCRLPPGDPAFDSDHCGYAAEMISNRLGIPALFFQGACGDLDPIRERTLEMNGGGLADSVVAMVRNGAFYPLRGPITTRSIDITLPLNIDDDGIGELRAKYVDRLGAAPHVRRHAERMISSIDAGQLPLIMPMMVQAWGFGGFRIIAMANEVTSTYHHIAKSLAGRQSWVTGYTNWIDGYVPGDQLLEVGGYEAGWKDDRGIAGVDTAGMSYSWPAPLRPPEGLVRTGIIWCVAGTD